jgi:hypothetical protein
MGDSESVHVNQLHWTMIAYHWALTVALCVIAIVLAVRALAAPWPEIRAWYTKLLLMAVFGGGVMIVAQRAWFVTFTTARSAPRGLTVRFVGSRERTIAWNEIDAAQTSSFDATPLGRFYVLRLYLRGRKLSIPLPRHPAADTFFASVVERSGLTPKCPEWQLDRRYGKSDWTRESQQAVDER